MCLFKKESQPLPWLSMFEFLDDINCPQCHSRDCICVYEAPKDPNNMDFDFICTNTNCFHYFEITINIKEKTEERIARSRIASEMRVQAELANLEKLKSFVSDKGKATIDKIIKNFKNPPLRKIPENQQTPLRL